MPGTPCRRRSIPVIGKVWRSRECSVFVMLSEAKHLVDNRGDSSLPGTCVPARASVAQSDNYDDSKWRLDDPENKKESNPRCLKSDGGSIPRVNARSSVSFCSRSVDWCCSL